jgi:hypothetical protein
MRVANATILATSRHYAINVIIVSRAERLIVVKLERRMEIFRIIIVAIIAGGFALGCAILVAKVSELKKDIENQSRIIRRLSNELRTAQRAYELERFENVALTQQNGVLFREWCKMCDNVRKR